MVQHAPIETHAASATVDPHTGHVTVWSACQCPYRAKMALGYLFNLDPSKSTLITPYVGGGFGSKAYLSIEDICLSLAMKASRPVKLVYSRKDDFISTVVRTPVRTKIKDAVMKDGTITAREMLTLWNAGAYNEGTYKLVVNALFAVVGNYKIPNFKYASYGVYTNLPAGSAFRGFGMPEVLWAVERQMDLVAERIGIDPLEIRRKNLTYGGYVNTLGIDMEDVKTEESLIKAADAIGWREKRGRGRAEGSLRRGVGIAFASKGVLLHKVGCYVRLHPDGTVETRIGAMEIGSGSMTGLAQMVAEEFKTPIEKVKIVEGNTDITPYDEATAGSRMTPITGSAVIRACRNAKARIFSLASKLLKEAPEKLDYEDGRVFVKDSPKRAVSIANLFHRTQYGTGTLAIDGAELYGTATYDLKTESGGRKAYIQSYTVGAQAVEVEVDVESGKVAVLKAVTAMDVGRAINPKNIEGQVEGGVAQGIGSTLYEEILTDEGGKVLNPTFTDYRVPTVSDLPMKSKTIIVESENKDGPYGAKCVGEFPIIPIAPAIASAIYDAVGIQFKEIPMTADRISAALRGKS